MKISVVGAGNVGASAVAYLAEENLADELVCVDIIEGLPQGKMLDLAEASPIRGYRAKFAGSNDYSAIKGSNVVVVTAGVPRKPGMSRLDLLKINEKIVKSVCEDVKKHAPDCVLVVVTNPLDVMCYVALKTTGFSPHRVLGMAGVLDTSRYRYFISELLNLHPSEIQAMVLGGHGDEMVPLISCTTVSGIPAAGFLTGDQIAQLVDRTRKGGAEIVNLLKAGSAFYAPAASIVEMVKAIVTDSQKILPAACYLQGQYGFSDVYCGVPARLGKKGVEEVIEVNLTENEKKGLEKSVSVVKQAIAEMSQ